MGKSSRDKGSRFERKIAKLFSDAFDMNIRRVPLSGGLDIKSDLYCPEDDSFPYFVECKNRKSFRFDSLFDHSSELYSFFNTAYIHSLESYVSDKYTKKQRTILIFTGGNFKCIYVMYHSSEENEILTYPTNPIIHTNSGMSIIKIENFFMNCNREKLVLEENIIQEDDGDY